MRAAYPEAPEEADNDVREDGTACHWLAAELFHGRFPALNSLSPNGRVLDEDMFDAADMYLDVLRSWPGVVPVVEQKMDCSVLHPGVEGTPDAWAYNPTLRTLFIGDLKYGFRFVEVWENLQMVIYAMALLRLLGLDNGLMDQNIIVQFQIIQPRSNHRDGPVRTWRVRASDLRALFNWIVSKAQDAMRPEAPCTPNPGCVDCPGRHACAALQNAAYTALEVAYGSVPHELDAQGIGVELSLLTEAAKRLEARITGLTAQAEHMVREGTVVPGWSLEPTYARERWQDGAEAKLLSFGTLMGVDLAKPLQAISPARARKLIPESYVKMFSHKPSTGVRLMKSDPLAAKKKFTPQP